MPSDQPEVRVGQVWQDCDKRVGERYLLVMRIIDSQRYDARAVVRVCTPEGAVLGGSETRIALRRMKPGATGYRMVRDAK